MSIGRILFILGVSCAFSLTSCSKSVPTEGGSNVAAKKALLEDLGNGVCRQPRSGVMWQIKEIRKIPTRKEANEYVNSLQLGGYNDWRLPTRAELLSLSELLLFPKGDCSIEFYRAHWVSDEKGDSSGYWEEYSLCGGSEFHWVTGKKGSVRAVRP